MKVIITGYTESVGKVLLSNFPDEWEVIKWDPRKDSFPEEKCDAIVLSHDGIGKDEQEMFEKNTFSFSSILLNERHKIVDGGILIGITSRRAIMPTYEEWDYSASKADTHAYMKAVYENERRIRITAIAPVWIESKMAEDGNAAHAISAHELGDLVNLLIVSKTMRIPEILIEPIS